MANATGEGEGDVRRARMGIFFVFIALTAGLLLRQLFRRFPVPYTVVLISFGMAIGAIFRSDDFKDYTSLARIDPHLLLLIFLPILIFESAFTMDVHTFFKNAGQILTLAAPGLLISTFLTSCIARYVFNYNWSWPLSLTFGAVLSATDPVAVVAILKELKAPKQLGTIIEGESLLNDGAAIVLFNVLLGQLTGEDRNGGEIVLYFVRVAIGGPLFGWICGKIAIFWLSHIFNDYLVEIMITLVATYLTYYIGEEVLQVSGVLAVVTMGIEINTKRTVIEPEVEEFLHRFWELAGYIANTLIFVLVGVIISQEAFSGVTYNDWLYLLLLYVLISVIRLISIEGLNPVLTHLGYGFSGKTVLVIMWGGLRGAVGLSLALVVAESVPDDGHKALFHVAGIVVLTLLINATTIKYLIKGLGLTDISEARLLAMTAGIKRIREAQKRAITTLKADKFLADAHWPVVEHFTYIHDPYKKHGPKEVNKGAVIKILETIVGYVRRHTVAPVLTKAQQHEALEEEIRQRMIKAQKISYWRQFQQGLLGRDAARILIALADNVLSDSGRFLSVKDLKFHWEIPYLARKARLLVEKVKTWKTASYSIAPPKWNWATHFYKVATHKAFDWLMITITVLYCGLILADVILNSQYRALEITIHMFYPVYIAEFVIKNVGLRKHYWKNIWDLFDFFLLPLTLVDIIIVEGLRLDTYGLLQLIRVMRLLRLLRTLGLIKRLAPFLLMYIDRLVNHHLRLGYDIGKGFLTGEEDMMQQFGKLALMDEEQTKELKQHSDYTRMEVIKSLGQVRRNHPDVVLSVKTHQASRSVLNYQKEIVIKLHNLGLIEQADEEALLEILAFRIKRLHSSSASMSPPDPVSILVGVTWLSGLDSEIISDVIEKAELVAYDTGDVIAEPGQEITSLYVVISGIAQVSTIITETVVVGDSDEESEDAEPNTFEKNLDIIGAGSVLNDMAVLTDEDFYTNRITCDTDIEMFSIAKEDMLELMELYPEIAEKMWKSCGNQIAIALLQELPEYQDWTATKLFLLLARAFVVSGSTLTNPLLPYEITEDHMHVLLIYGEVRRLSTKERLVAPCLVPRSAKHLMMNMGNPQIMVIQSGEFDTEQTAIISTDSSALFPEAQSALVTYLKKIPQLWEDCKRTSAEVEDSQESMKEISVINNTDDNITNSPGNVSQIGSNDEQTTLSQQELQADNKVDEQGKVKESEQVQPDDEASEQPIQSKEESDKTTNVAATEN